MKKTLLAIAYWALELTWGGLLTWPGLIVAIFCILFLKGKPHRNGYSFIIEVGGNWGGINLGAVSLCGNYHGTMFYEETRAHEAGHSIQNIWFGPLQLFIVAIPSAIRYWHYEIGRKKGRFFPDDWYYSIWFESQASSIGAKYIFMSEALG